MKNQYYQPIYDFVSKCRIIDTHCHHMQQHEYADFSLNRVLSICYVAWSYGCDYDNPEERAHLVETIGTNTYFTWFAKALSELYADGTPLNTENWDAIDAAIRAKYAEDPYYHIHILEDICHYEGIVLDKYERPGYDNGRPSLFKPTFRCDSFLCAHIRGVTDENKTDPYAYFDVQPASLAEYIAMMEETIVKKKAEGCCALKIAIAYERGLDFEDVPYEAAEAAFGNPDPTPEEKKRFTDYVMYRIAEIAAKLDIPIQIHTGLGILQKSNAMQLRDLIDANPKTNFVLFHGSYPWMDDVLGLACRYRNVYPDTCWLPIISTSAAIRFLSEALEVTDAYRLTWGCDTWNSEESYGALLAMRHVLATVLSEKVEMGEYTFDYACRVAENILYNNAKKIYHL